MYRNEQRLLKLHFLDANRQKNKNIKLNSLFINFLTHKLNIFFLYNNYNPIIIYISIKNQTYILIFFIHKNTV